MDKRILEIEADTIEEAREKAKSMVSQDYVLHSEEVIADGEIKEVIAIDETENYAFDKAVKKIPIYAKILEKAVLSESKQSIIEIKEFNESSARKKALEGAGSHAKIIKIYIETLLLLIKLNDFDLTLL